MKRKYSLVLEHLEDRLTPSTLGQTWPDPGHLTLSFAPDTTKIGGTTSSLFKLLNSSMPTSAWQTAILQAFQTWADQTNINIGVTSDGGLPFGTTGAVQGDSRFGDIRIGAKSLPAASVSTASPFSWTGTTWGGDMLLNSMYNFGLNGQGQYDLYTIALHEAGHALGLGDASVGTDSAMYESYIGPRTGLGQQDIADIQALYGVRQPDAYNHDYSNHSFATAAPLGNNAINFQADIGQLGESDFYKVTAPNMLLLSSATFQLQAAGISLLEPNVTVYDSSYHVLASKSSFNPLNNNVTVTVNGVQAGRNYYVKVSGATNNVFGMGGYQMNISYNSLLTWLVSDVVFPLVDLVGGVLYSTINTALPLPSAFGPDKTDQRFDYLWRADLPTSTSTNYYQVQSPANGSASSFVMHVMTWEMDPNGLHPIIHAFDGQKNPLPLQVLGNSDGMYSIQVPSTAANSTYYVEVAAFNPSGSNSTGRYVLGIKFDAVNPPVTTNTLASNTLATSTSTDQGTLVMAEDGLFHFSLGADNGSTSSSAVLTLTVYDSAGNAVFSFDTVTGKPSATGVVYLGAGTYTVRISVKSTSGAFQPIKYWLFGDILSDPIGPYQSNPTSGSTGSSTSGGGYTYGGSSSMNTSTANQPAYY
jgi:hypothetical protein